MPNVSVEGAFEALFKLPTWESLAACSERASSTRCRLAFRASAGLQNADSESMRTVPGRYSLRLVGHRLDVGDFLPFHVDVTNRSATVSKIPSSLSVVVQAGAQSDKFGGHVQGKRAFLAAQTLRSCGRQDSTAQEGQQISVSEGEQPGTYLPRR